MTSMHFVKLAREAEIRAGSEQRTADLYNQLAQAPSQVQSLVASFVDAQAMLGGIHRNTLNGMIERGEVAEMNSTGGKRWISLASINLLIAPGSATPITDDEGVSACAVDADLIRLAADGHIGTPPPTHPPEGGRMTRNDPRTMTRVATGTCPDSGTIAASEIVR